DREAAERAADGADERKLVLEIDFRRGDLDEPGDRSGTRRGNQDGAGPVLRNDHVLRRVDVCVFVGELEPGQPVAAGKRKHKADLGIGGEAGSGPVEREERTALLSLGDQERPIKDTDDAGYALKRLLEMGLVEASARADVEAGPVPNRWRRRRF